jgi:hypothetical protein
MLTVRYGTMLAKWKTAFSDYLSLKQIIHLSTNFSAFFCGFWIFLQTYSALPWKLTGWIFFVQRLWKCNIWIAEFFEFYTYTADSRNVNNVVCVSASHAQRPCALRITFVFGSNTCVSFGKHLLRAEDHATLSICGHDLYSCLLHHSTYVVIFRSVWTPEQASCL